jgi:hypothetical protein
VISVQATGFDDHVPHIFNKLGEILLPLILLSLAVKTRTCKLPEITHLCLGVLPEFQTLSVLLQDADDCQILDRITGHFIARLRVNAFEVILTWAALNVERPNR